MARQVPIALDAALIACEDARIESTSDVVRWTCLSCLRACERGERAGFRRAPGNRGCEFVNARLARARRSWPQVVAEG